MTLLERLRSKGPKRILALDGGGIRGAITLGFLERIEAILRERYGRAELKLCEYFDLIGGTSTGAIIAAALAIGMSAADVRKKYLELGGRVFGKRKWKKWEAWFDAEPLNEELTSIFEERTLGDPTISTGLCVVAKRADTNSVWPIINHPQGMFYAKNSQMLLRQVVRASTAAPVYFIPEMLDVGEGEMGAFVDGGVSMANNPALQLFLVATLKGFPFHWPIGEDRLLLVSVGTGTWSRRATPEQVTDRWITNWGLELPGMLMDDANWHNQLILQYLSNSKTAWIIDREVGKLDKDLLTDDPALTYLRYDVPLEPQVLGAVGLADLADKLHSLREMSAGQNREDLAEIGNRAAKHDRYGVQEDHLASVFDLR
ncbi:MAG: patatin-like phospholipase family protein [Planctomycetota bacterium]|jgi:hypothetical protein